MSEAGLLEVLRKMRFVEGMTESQLQQLAALVKQEAMAAHDVLFRERDKIGKIFFVIEGSVALELRVPGQGIKRVHTVGPGELLGWSPLLSRSPMTATARALVPTKVLALDAGQVLALCHHDPEFGFAFMTQTARSIARRLEATRLQLLDVYRLDLPAVPEDQEGGQG